MNYILLIASLMGVFLGCEAQEPAPLATIGETIRNESVLIGANAYFYCEVIGEQGIGETLQFSKIYPDPHVISVDSEVLDSGKHTMSDKYELKIKDVGIEDAGTYECSFAAQDYVAYLTVSDPPTSSDIYWNDGDSWTPKGQTGNLTCSASRSYPPASFRWYRGSTALTREAIRITEEDSNGYGKAWSFLEMEPQSSDEGDVITCYVDMPHKDAYYTETVAIRFSGASQAVLSVSVFLLSLLSALRV